MGKPVDNDLVSRITTSSAATAFKSYIDGAERRYITAAQRGLATARTQSDVAQGVGVIKSIYENKDTQYNNALKDYNTYLADEGMFANGIESPLQRSTKETLKTKKDLVDKLEREKNLVANDLVSAFQTLTGKKLSITDIVPPPTVAPPVGNSSPDPEAQMALQAIQAQPQNEATIRAAYKKRTGKKLP